MAAKPRIRRPQKRKREDSYEEELFSSDDSLVAWWLSVSEDPRFYKVVMAVERRRSLRDKIQTTPHAQHVADGFRQGYAEAIEKFQTLAYSASAHLDGDGHLEQAANPELNDATDDEAARRFGS